MKKYADKDKKFIAKVGEWLFEKVTNLEKDKDVNREVVEIAEEMAFRVSVLAQGTKTEEESTGETKYATNANYDFTKSFADQIDDYKRGIMPQRDTLIVSETPELWKKVGFNSLPVTVDQTHVDYALNRSKDFDHHIGETVLKMLPQLIKEPIAIIQSQSPQHKDRAVVVLDASHNNCNSNKNQCINQSLLVKL